MGDRFYEAQKGSNRAAVKPKRKLKSDWVRDIQDRLDVENLDGLIKTDLTTLKNLYEALNAEDI